MRGQSFATSTKDIDNPDLSKLNYENEKEVELWYNKTNKVNDILLLTTKLLDLLLIAIITSEIALIFFLTIFSSIYGVDSCVNMYCMYLSFGFSNKIYRKLFCGNQCIRCSFPFIKMWAFTTCSCLSKSQNDYNQEENVNNIC